MRIDFFFSRGSDGMSSSLVFRFLRLTAYQALWRVEIYTIRDQKPSSRLNRGPTIYIYTKIKNEEETLQYLQI